jgi:hypothetical protein
MARALGRAAGGDGIGLAAMSGSGEIGGGMMIISKLWLRAARGHAQSLDIVVVVHVRRTASWAKACGPCAVRKASWSSGLGRKPRPGLGCVVSEFFFLAWPAEESTFAPPRRRSCQVEEGQMAGADRHRCTGGGGADGLLATCQASGAAGAAPGRRAARTWSRWSIALLGWYLAAFDGTCWHRGAAARHLDLPLCLCRDGVVPWMMGEARRSSLA